MSSGIKFIEILEILRVLNIKDLKTNNLGYKQVITNFA